VTMLALPTTAVPAVAEHTVSAPDVLILALRLQALIRAVAANPTTAVELRAATLASMAGQFDRHARLGHRDAVQARECAAIARSARWKLLGGDAR
jgi:hypothetical protein